MRFVTFQHDNEANVGVLRSATEIISLAGIYNDMISLIEAGADGLEHVKRFLLEIPLGLPINDVKLMAPIPKLHRNIICLGKNYAAHAQESNQAWGDKIEIPEYPIIFTKAPTTINGPYDEIPYDPTVSTAIDYEAELAVIIGRSGKNIPTDQAMTYIFGYTVINDLTARDMQRRHKQFFKGKSLDGHAPMGPWIVTADEISDPQNLQVTCHVNEIEKQNGHTSQMIFPIAETISQLSLGMTLIPGEIIATGTPSGVGFARTPPEFLKPGDVVACSVEKIGTIRNRIAG